MHDALAAVLAVLLYRSAADLVRFVNASPAADRHEPQPEDHSGPLGHATLAETMDTYGHLFADTDDLGRTAVDQALRPVLAEPGRNRARWFR